MGWKIFFWVYLALAILSYVSVPPTLNPIDIVGYPISIIELLGLYSFAYKKKILEVKYWKVLFWVYITFFVALVLGEFTPLKNIIPGLSSGLFAGMDATTKMMAQIFTFALFGVLSYVLKSLAYPKGKK